MPTPAPARLRGLARRDLRCKKPTEKHGRTPPVIAARGAHDVSIPSLKSHARALRISARMLLLPSLRGTRGGWAHGTMSPPSAADGNCASSARGTAVIVAWSVLVPHAQVEKLSLPDPPPPRGPRARRLLPVFSLHL